MAIIPDDEITDLKRRAEAAAQRNVELTRELEALKAKIAELASLRDAERAKRNPAKPS